jgi:hypothetical protein
MEIIYARRIEKLSRPVTRQLKFIDLRGYLSLYK